MLRCSFCSTPQSETEAIIAGSDAYICHACVAEAEAYLEDNEAASPSASRSIFCSFCGKRGSEADVLFIAGHRPETDAPGDPNDPMIRILPPDVEDRIAERIENNAAVARIDVWRRKLPQGIWAAEIDALVEPALDATDALDSILADLADLVDVEALDAIAERRAFLEAAKICDECVSLCGEICRDKE
ncbi:MAG: ClpX C4-type zinc finger protein [Bradymonadaceae bacterium]